MSDTTGHGADGRRREQSPAHEEIEILLAGYALRSLSGDDAEAADRALSEHVPGCSSCRATLDAFSELSGELALAADPLEPPELLWARLRRDVDDTAGAGVTVPRVHRSRFGGASLIAAAASIVAVVAVSAAAFVVTRDSEAEDLRARLANVMETVRAGGDVQPLAGAPGAADGGLVEVAAPDLERLSLVGHEVPSPAPGNVYRVWLGSATGWDLAGEFVPDEAGWVAITVPVDPARHDRIAICEEPAGSQPTTPGTVRWASTFEAT